MDPVFKTCFLDGSGNVSHVFVFCGDKDNSGADFFSRSEYNMLTTKKVKIVCSDLYLHVDDSIYDIKRKILYTAFELEAHDHTDLPPAFSYDEMYLFGIVKQEFRLLDYYRNITDNESHVLNLSLLAQSLVNYTNVSDNESIGDEIMQIYRENEINKTLVYEDLQKMPWFYSENNVKHRKISLGQRFLDNSTELQTIDESFVVNPFDLWNESLLLNKKKHQAFENDFLFHFGDVQNNTLYVALAEPVMQYVESKGISSQDIVPVYYPVLGKQNVVTSEALQTEKQRLVGESRSKFFDVNLKHGFQKVSLFYDVFLEQKTPIQYASRGIGEFFLVLHPEDRSKKMPLENIFKHIHATLQVPFIQFNPGMRQENTYRVFYNDTAKNGKKIPYLPKNIITHFLKKTSRVQNICIFLDQRADVENTSDRPQSLFDTKDFVQMILLDNGDIQLQGVTHTPMLAAEFNGWLTRMCQPALTMINEFLQQSGYFIRNFHSIDDTFVEVVNMHYVCTLEMEKLSLKKFMGCLSSLFYHELENDKQDGMQMRYKRVENFRKMSPEDEYIAALLRHTRDKKIIESQVRKKFPGDPKQKLRDYEQRHMEFMIPGRYVNKKIEMLENPGFKTVIQRSGNVYTLEMHDINLSQYLHVLPIYVDSMLRMNMDSSVLTSERMELCKATVMIQDEAPPVAAQMSALPPMPSRIFEEKEKEPKLLADSDDEGEDDQGVAEVKTTKKDEDKEDDDEEEEDEDYDYGLDMYDDDDDEEDEDNDDEDKDNDDKDNDDKDNEEQDNEDEEQTGGGSDTDSEDSDSDDDDDLQQYGKKERISTYWGRRIEKRDPLLFKVLKRGFSRVNQDEQPVVLTQEEFQQVDPGAYTNALKYRTGPKGQANHYICPRYWCTKPGQEGPMTEEEAKSGKCGKVMNTTKDRSKEEPVGEYVIEYSGLNPEPGFVNTKKLQMVDAQGKNVCAPKCFKKWSTEGEKNKRKLCAPEHYDENYKEGVAPAAMPELQPVRPTDKYVLESNSFPLRHGRVAKLPIPIQTFLGTNNETCVMDRRIKPNCGVLLRYGPEMTPQGKQSFLACLADVYSYETNRAENPVSLAEFKKIVMESMTLDSYLQLHNSNIASVFQPKDHPNLDTVDLSPYQSSQYMKHIDTNDEDQVSFLKYTALSFEHFQKFLQDDSVTIDHTYLWELMSRPNPKLFKDGLNLAILEMPEQDNTNNVIVVCPTNAYAFPLFDKSRKTVLMLRQMNDKDAYYETIYRYYRTHKIQDGERVEQENIKKLFTDKSRDIKGLSTVMNVIRNVVNGKCGPRAPNVYNFQHSKTAEEIVAMMPSMSGLKITTVVMNFQGKVIGFLVAWSHPPSEVTSKKDFYLPCYPSSMKKHTYEIKWIDNPDLWTDYHSTVSFLRHVYAVSDQAIPCEPKFRVVDKEMITGVLTDTNQFVQIDKPIDNISMGDGLKTLSSSNYILSDKKIQVKAPKTEETIVVQNEESHRVFLETQFYRVFRSTMRILLNLYRHRFRYKEILELHESAEKTYRAKRKEVVALLKTIGEEQIVFQAYDTKVLMSLGEIYNCQGNCKEKKFCLYREENGQCQLLIPDKHLVSGTSNETVYYARLADELLRHKRIHLFMFYPDSYLNLSDTDYKIESNEFVITDNEFKNDYFRDLEPYLLRNYARKTTYETAVPTTRPYPVKANWVQEYEKAALDA